MSFNTPPLEDWRRRGRDYVLANLPPRAVALPNSPLRVMSDNSAGMSYMVMLYLSELAAQLLPDTAGGEWLRRHAEIWLKEGPKPASYAVGMIALTGLAGSVVLAGSTYVTTAADGSAILIKTVGDTTLTAGATPTAALALTPGSGGNLDAGIYLSASAGQQGVSTTATVIALAGGVNAEANDDLRVRVLDRIQKPPMGGDSDDYVAWALEVPGVTRVWCSPNEMGPGTVTVRFMMDDLRASLGGFPTSDDVTLVRAHLNALRPVTVLDMFVFAPIPEPINYAVLSFSVDTPSNRAATQASVSAMLQTKAAPASAANGTGVPAQTVYAAWVSDAILQTPGIASFDLVMTDHPMPSAGSLAVPGTVIYAP
jgi:uncharacterized phage protein gp47/JayE